jgi:hypothetical protein
MNKKVLAAVCAILAGVFSVSAQGESCFGKDVNIAQAGLGVGTNLGASVNSLMAVGPVVTYERGVHDLVSVGGTMSFATKTEEYGGSFFLLDNHKYVVRYTEVPITARGAFHPFNLPVLIDKIPVRDKVDVYAGLAMGFRIYTAKYESGGGGTKISTDTVDRFRYSAIIGGRYFFTKQFAAYLEETGGSHGIINFGASMKF